MIKEVGDRSPFHDPAQVHDRNLVRNLGDHPQIMGDEEDRHAVLGLQPRQQLQNLGLHGHVQCGGGLVRDQQQRIAGKRQGNHGALAHAARHLMRVGIRDRGGPCDSHLLQQGHGSLPGFGPAYLGQMKEYCLLDLVADGMHRTKRCHRLLEDHRNLIAAHLPDHGAGRVQGCQVERHILGPVVFAAPQLNRSGLNPPGWRGQYAQDCLGRDGLATAGLADHPQRAAGMNIQIDIFNGVDNAFLQEEADL